ncbi:hypothetical protein FB45DRAFT_1116848 [Roridomyces roridus]|uniref:Uncharacterized protein n=1 Tax=Roridomyces roridus TaxID=1738132 RepID=A0AAD7CEL8_9AGAR|nr:hypothetical protein FB45DRAFT_1116848 [Roridomyces roridus]
MHERQRQGWSERARTGSPEGSPARFKRELLSPVPGLSPSRGPRASALRAGEDTSLLFEAGGALDSQTGDYTYVERLEMAHRRMGLDSKSEMMDEQLEPKEEEESQVLKDEDADTEVDVLRRRVQDLLWEVQELKRELKDTEQARKDSADEIRLWRLAAGKCGPLVKLLLDYVDITQINF